MSERWDPSLEELLQVAFRIMSTRWSRSQRQELFDFIVQAIFPGDERSRLWMQVDATARTRDGVPFHQLTVRMYDEPVVWYRNLRLLQIREYLGLDCMLYITLGYGCLIVGVVLNRLLAIRSVVGDARIAYIRPPVMRRFNALMNPLRSRFVTQQDYPSPSHVRSQAMRHRSTQNLRPRAQ